MEKSARTYTLTEETLNKVKAEIMEAFEWFANMGIEAKNKKEMSAALRGFKGGGNSGKYFCRTCPRRLSCR